MNILDYTTSEEERLLLYIEYCDECNKNNTIQLTPCCCKRLCQECYQNYTKYFSCKYCSENILKRRFINFCDKKMAISFVVFIVWYLINIVSLYLLQHYLYDMKMNFGELVVLMLMALNSSLAALVIAILLISMSYTLSMRVVNKIRELCDRQEVYTDL